MATIRSEAYAPTGVAKVWHAVIAFFTLVLRTNTGRIGLAVVGIHVVLALIGPWITPFPPTEYHIQDQ